MPADALATGPFRDGDRVAMIGDSITYDGRWWAGLREQLLARAPGLRCDFHNCGIPGGSAGGAVSCYDWDIAPLRPTVALVMFGMNDVRRDLYGSGPPRSAEQAEALRYFQLNSENLVGRLLADGARVILLTPTPYDHHARVAEPDIAGVDEGLARCAEITRALASARQLPLIDLHAPLRRRCAALEALIPEDRVHPGEAGNEAMAELVIAALLPGAPVAIPPALRAASRALRDAELQQRTLAMFRSWVGPVEGLSSDQAVLRFLDQRQPTEQPGWVRDQMVLCRSVLARQSELAAEVAELRARLAAVARP